MFRTVPLSIIRSFSLYTQQWYMSYRFADSLRAGSGRNCPKHVEFYSKNKFEKLVHLVGFIIRIPRICQLLTLLLCLLLYVFLYWRTSRLVLERPQQLIRISSMLSANCVEVFHGFTLSCYATNMTFCI